MKVHVRLLSVFSLLLVCGSSVFAQECKPVEFAEMSIMNSSELNQLFCTNERIKASAGRQALSISEAALKMSELGAGYARIGDMRGLNDTNKRAQDMMNQSSRFNRQAEACIAENDRVMRVIKRADEKAGRPQCN